MRVERIERVLREKGGRIEGVWAGCATSWIKVSVEDEAEEQKEKGGGGA